MPVDPAAIGRILECGAMAPSGDNLQPWTVVAGTEAIGLSVDRSRDRSLYNFQGRASLIALGAMIENLTLAGRQFGVDLHTTLAADQPDLVSARLALTPTAPRPDPL